MKRRILVTAALPYANGDIHLGHLVEYIQADIWARFQKMRGHECWFVCADDAHGTPIMLRAEAEKTPPETLIKKMRDAHRRDFAGFLVNFDNYHSTHSQENRQLAEDMFAALKQRGCIVEKEIQQLYDPQKGMFLPDRYVRGDCPHCSAANQYGDSCEKCGNVHTPADLHNPVSVLSGAVPEIRPSLHYFLRLRGEEENLQNWLNTAQLQREAANKLQEWLRDGLRDWDISRDPPYFGFRIPDASAEKYFYVWLDAPIGYIASFKNFCESDAGKKANVVFDDFWRDACDNDTELYHFIGKDILYFHGLFWPTMLGNSGYRRPTRLFTHGFLTINGEKMSKSRGTFITAASYLRRNINPEALRYYYACKLGERVEDIDMNMSDFALRVNTDLIGKLVNIPSRVAGFIHKFFDGRLDDTDAAAGATDNCAEVAGAEAQALAQAYERRRYHEVVRIAMKGADAINIRIDEARPWLLAKDAARHADLHRVCSHALRRFDLLLGYLSPILPALADKVVQFLAREAYVWREDGGISPLPPGHRINPFFHLMERMDDDMTATLIQPETPETLPVEAVPVEDAAAEDDANRVAEISIDDFAKMELRIAVVTAAAEVEGADKLLCLTLDVGDGRLRQVFSGIKKHYTADALVGRRVVYLANLKPRKMRFGLSEGMVLAAGGGGGEVVLLQPDGDAPPGAKVS